MHKTLRQVGFHGLLSIGDLADRVQFHSQYIEESSNTIKTSVFAETDSLGTSEGLSFER